MSTLEKVMQLRSRGLTDPEISQALLSEAISPLEINEAISQSKIKSMLAKESESDIKNYEIPMQPSIMTSMESDINQAPIPSNAQNEIQSSYQPSVKPYEEQQIPEPRQEQEYQEYYPEYQPVPATDIETINDIAEQIFEEKSQELKKHISSFSYFKDDFSIKVDELSKRIERIERHLENLELAIIKKMSDYGQNIDTISKEMQANRQSFSKIIDPLTDNIKELQKITGNFKENQNTNQFKNQQKQSFNGKNNNASDPLKNYIR